MQDIIITLPILDRNIEIACTKSFSPPPPGDEFICEYLVVTGKLYVNGSLKSSKIKHARRFISLATQQTSLRIECFGLRKRRITLTRAIKFLSCRLFSPF